MYKLQCKMYLQPNALAIHVVTLHTFTRKIKELLYMWLQIMIKIIQKLIEKKRQGGFRLILPLVT